jgi:hypothetical protein
MTRKPCIHAIWNVAFLVNGPREHLSLRLPSPKKVPPIRARFFRFEPIPSR